MGTAAAQSCPYNRTLLLAISFIVIDILVATITYGRGSNQWVHFTNDFYNYNIYTSLLELWLIAIGRALLILGAILGFAYNPIRYVPRLARMKPLMMVVIVAMWVCTNIKLLLFTEVNEGNLAKPEFWSLYIWTNMALLGAYMMWGGLSNKKTIRDKYQESLSSATKEEIQKLMDSDEEETEGTDEERDTKRKPDASSLRTLARLFKLSHPDWHIVLAAFASLLLCTSSKLIS